MDLGAFVRIDDLGKVAKDNGIEIPRLRGYRLMKDERPVSREEVEKMKEWCAIDVVEGLCTSVPFWNGDARCRAYNAREKQIKSRYLVAGRDEDGRSCFVDIRWDRIHGKKRKILKYAIKKKQRMVQAQYDAWNRYAGQEGVLYIHSRMGGGNWKWYDNKDSILKAPWFLERVDDYWDSTYCDFYAKIEVTE